jgi:hypothetical protein
MIGQCPITWAESGREYFSNGETGSRRYKETRIKMPGGITGPPCSWGDINAGTWLSRLGKSQMRQ